MRGVVGKERGRESERRCRRTAMAAPWARYGWIPWPRVIRSVGTGVIEEKLAPDGRRGGAGRILNLQNHVALEEIVKRAKAHLRLDKGMCPSSHLLRSDISVAAVQVARPPTWTSSDVIKTIAICAGSGGSLLRGVKADLYFTGEMQHVRN